MQFKRLYMRNFLAVGSDAVEILFDQYKGLTLISGANQDVPGRSSNGSGKSTIIEGIFYGLTGRTLRKINADNILHNSNAKLCRVEIEFDSVKIVRTLEPSTVKLFVDGVDKTVTGAIKETKKLIDEQVGVNFETLSNILIFGQHNMVSFLDAIEGDKREIIENLMNIREYNAYEEQARLMLRELKGQHKSLLEQFAIHENHCDEQQKVVEQQEKVLSDFRLTTRREIQTIDSQIASIPDLAELQSDWRAYDDHKKRLQSVRDCSSALANKRIAAEANVKRVEDARRTDLDGRTALVDRSNSLKQKNELIENRKREMWNSQVVPLVQEAKRIAATADTELKLAINNTVTLKDLICPVCSNKVSKDHLIKLIETARAKHAGDIALATVVENQAKALTEEQKTAYFTAKEKLTTLLAEAEKAVTDFDAAIAVKYTYLANSVLDVAAIASEHIACVSEQKELEKNTPSEPEVSVTDIGKLESELQSLTRLKAEKERSIDQNPHMDVIASLKDSLAKTETIKNGVFAQIKDVETQIPYLEFWVQHTGKEGIKSYVIDQIIPTLNEQIEYWMALIYQGAISVTFDKFFNVTITNNSTGNLMVFGQGSGGERRRIDLAIMLAFRQVMKLSTGKDPNILFFDEIAENLDEEGIYRLWDAMEDIAKDSTLFVITHNPTLLNLIQNKSKLDVVKKDGAMKLVA
jgi:DNA repair exonuclease SbcCD ATPase subunit